MMTIKKNKKIKITKDMDFSELLTNFPEALEVLLENRMHCIGCPMSHGETLEQGALAHGINPKKLIEELNKKLEKKKNKSKKK